MAPAAALRNAVIAQVGAQAAMESVALQAGRAAATGNMLAQRAEGQVQKADNVAQQAGSQGQMQQGMQMGMQMASQLGSTLGQLPQQAGQMIMQPMQQLTQPLQQVTSMFSQMGGMGGDKRPDGTDRNQPAVQSPPGRWIWTGFGRRTGARRVSPGRRRHARANAVDVQPDR